MSPQETIAKGVELHAASVNHRAALECLREGSGWNMLVKPWIEREQKNLTADILKGGCESYPLYLADCKVLDLFGKLLTLPERTRVAAQTTLARQQAAQGVVPEEQTPEFLAAAALVRSEGSAERLPAEKEGLG